jgi:tRNA G18 (ribose-2'-O)-methylase SpoU
MHLVVILHNLRSTHNVGSIFRTADGAGVEKLYLCGITPAPVDRFGKYLRDVEKVALGAERDVPWEKVRSTVPLLRKLKKEGWTIAAVEQSPRSILYYQFAPQNSTVLRSYDGRILKRKGVKLAVVLGAEVKGLPPSVLNIADVILEIPMRGAVVRQAHHPRHTRRGKESLNVSVAAGVVLFELRK